MVLRSHGLLRAAGLLLAALLLLTGCRRQQPLVHPGPPPPPPLLSTDPWQLSINQPGHVRVYLGNGYLGVNASQEGLGRDGEERLDAFVSGFYVNEGFAVGPQWAAPEIQINGKRLSPEGARDYTQTLDLRRGLLQTRYRWRGRPATEVEITLFPARHDPHLGVVQVALTPRRRCRVAISPAAAGVPGCAAAAVDRAGVGTEAPLAAAEVTLSPGERWVFTRYVGICAGRDAPAPERQAQSVAEQAAKQGFAAVLRAHTAAWERLWARDLTLEGDPRAQQVLNAFRYYLLASVCEGRADSVPPMGLSSAIYQGHIFWDADVWVFPALVPQYPELARSIVEYRYRTLPAAQANARAQGLRGADYAWESAQTGKETVNGEFVHGRHVNAGVALAQWQYYLWTGDRAWLKQRGYPVLRATADYWLSRVVRAGERYEIHGVMGPDETRGPVNNNAWTNAMAQLNLEVAARAARLVGETPDPRWSAVAARLWIPFDPRAGRYRQHDQEEQAGHKQADCELLIYPRRLAMPDEVAARTYDHYKSLVSTYGPAMTASIYATIAARLGRPAEAKERFHESWEPFLVGPYHLFSEKRTTPRTCFITGLAGTLQSILYGFAGLEPTEAGLRVNAALPPGWHGLRLTGIRWRGQTRDLDLKPAAP
ncbi:MAG: glycoside hydrolase family 65 protein [Armatimonadetes bacterium]|nr:glycoside hydrolase family 65 protein [Armatimonadota bacterium]